MDSEMKLSFDNLDEEVIQKGLCGRCGACVSFCSAVEIGALEMGDDGFPKYKDKEKCLKGGICYYICPQTRVLEEEVKEKWNWKAPIGYYRDAFSVRSTENGILKIATDGGFVTSLLLSMFDHNRIDGAVVSERVGLFGRKPKIATTRDEIINAAGSHFSESAFLEEIGSDYSSCVPLMKTIRDNVPKSLHKLAVVGTPCQINAIRKMQVMNIVPSEIVVFTIGLFCMQCFTINDLMNKEFAKKHKISLEDISKMNIKEDFILQMKSGVKVHIPLEEIEMIARPACLACKYFSNVFADVSVGGLGSPEGYTTVLVRSITGKEMVSDALYKGFIEHKPTESIKEAEVDKQKMISLITAFSENKTKRSESYIEAMCS